MRSLRRIAARAAAGSLGLMLLSFLPGSIHAQSCPSTEMTSCWEVEDDEGWKSVAQLALDIYFDEGSEEGRCDDMRVQIDEMLEQDTIHEFNRQASSALGGYHITNGNVYFLSGMSATELVEMLIHEAWHHEDSGGPHSEAFYLDEECMVAS